MSAAAETFRMTRRRPNRLEVAALAIVLMLTSASLLYALHWEMQTFFLGVLLVLTVLATPLLFLYQARFARTAKLVVDDHGMTMRSGLPRFLQAGAMGDWTLRWEDIDSVRVLSGLGIVQIRPKGRVVGIPVALRPADWVGESRGDLASTLEKRGVYRWATTDRTAEAVDFDLWRHPATRAMLILCAALVAYAGVDTMLRREAWAEWSLAYNVPHAVLGILAALVAAAVLLRPARPVPALIAAVVALLVGSSAASASYSALIRVNQLAGGPLEAKVFRRNASCDALVPVEAGLPTIKYTELAQPYWCSHPADASHEVLVRRGMFGLYQVDLGAHTEAIRRFRGGRKN